MTTNQPIRLFVPTGIYPPEIGGPATYVPLLERHLPQHGFIVDVLPFRVVRFLPKGLSHLVYFFFCLRGALRADIVYAQDAVSVGFPARLASMLLRKPFVVKIVGDHVWEQGRQRFGISEGLDDFALYQMGRPYLLFLRLLQLFVVRGARKVILPGIYLKKIVLRWGIKPERIAVVYNGIELPEVPAFTRTVARPLVASVGRLVPWKGYEGIIESIKSTLYHLAIIGDGPERALLEKKAVESGAGGRVIFTGALPRAEMLSWCRAADVFVLNSSYEGLPHTLVEVMSLGTPVIATDIEANRDVLAHGREGLLVPLGDTAALTHAIEETLSDKEARDRRVTAARVRAADFSAEQTVHELTELLKRL